MGTRKVKTFTCACGAQALINHGNAVVAFPGGQSVRLCSRDCPKIARVRREADEAWRQLQLGRSTTLDNWCGHD